MKPRIFVTRPLPVPVLELLARECDVRSYADDSLIPPAELGELCRDVDGMLVIFAQVNEDFLARAPKLRVVVNCSAGTDHIDVAACTRRGIVVTNTPDVVSDATADMAFALLLAVAALRERGAIYGGKRSVRTWVGLAIIAYAMLVYPLLGMAFGHGYPQAPVFGLVPCPTTIFTFGMLLLAAQPKRLLLWLPLIWSVIGLFAAVKFGIKEDVGLILAGVVTAGLLLWKPSAEKAMSVEESTGEAA